VSSDLETEFAVVVGEDAISHTVDFTRSLLPAILGAGIATEEEGRAAPTTVETRIESR
jgi:hypothetical protein